MTKICQKCREIAARVCDAADKSTHPADLADMLRALPAREPVTEERKVLMERLKVAQADIERLMATCTTETNRADQILTKCESEVLRLIPSGQIGLRQRIKQAIHALKEERGE